MRFLVTGAAHQRSSAMADKRDFTYIDNVVQANMLACRAPAAAIGQVFNVGCGMRVSLLDLWRTIQVLTDVQIEPLLAESRVGDVRDSLASLDSIQSVLSYRPLIDLREGLRRTLAAFPRGQR